MSLADRDLYFVALKVFLEKDRKFLITKDGFGDWDIPGGRIRKEEFDTPYEQIIARLMSKELGNNFSYKLGNPIILMRHERVEEAAGNPTVRIFAVGYQASFEKGEINLASHHTKFLWVDPNNFKAEDYFTNGWLKGVREYLELRKNTKT